MNNDELEQLMLGASGTTFVMALVFPLGLLVMVPFLLLQWRAIYRWLPRRQDYLVGKVERALLLYTPLRKQVLILHIFFHASMLFLVVLFILLFGTTWEQITSFLLFAVPTFLFALGIRWLAHLISK